MRRGLATNGGLPILRRYELPVEKIRPIDGFRCQEILAGTVIAGAHLTAFALLLLLINGAIEASVRSEAASVLASRSVMAGWGAEKERPDVTKPAVAPPWARRASEFENVHRRPEEGE